VETRAEPNLRGKFVTVTEQALTLQVNGRVMELPRAEIVSVFEVRRKSLKKPLLIGIAIGAGAGAALGAAAGGCPPSDFVCWPRKVTIPVTAAAGAIAGAVFGSVAGLFRRERVLRYQAAGSRP
jgi:membrane associated rhomboid family serine protease